MISLSELISKDAPISGKLRIHYSIVPIETLEGKSQMDYSETKPRGFWYGFGREWIDYVERSTDLKHKRGKYIYFVKVHDLKRVLQLKGCSELIRFSKQYGNGVLINWSMVAKKYSGIEINPHSEVAQSYSGGDGAFMELSWYKHWDVASGCIWDLDNISIKLIFPRQTDDKT